MSVRRAVVGVTGVVITFLFVFFVALPLIFPCVEKVLEHQNPALRDIMIPLISFCVIIGLVFALFGIVFGRKS